MRILTLTVTLSAIMLAGCGQKGPLYIAQDKGPGETAPLAQTDTDNTESADNKKKGSSK